MKQLILIIITGLFCGCGNFSAHHEQGALDAAFPQIKESGPVHQSKLFTVDSTVINGQAEVSVPLDTPEDAAMVILGEENAVLKSSASNPISGRSFAEPELKSMNLPSMGINFELKNLNAGSHKLKLEKLTKGSVKVLISQPKSPLTLEFQVKPLAAKSGEMVVIEARISDEQLPGWTSVTANYIGCPELTLKDDGVQPDSAPHDGVFTGTFTAPEVRGFQKITIHVRAGGTRYNGSSFMRNASASLMVNSGGTIIKKESITESKNDLKIPVTASCAYNARVEIIYGSGDKAVAWERKDVEMQANENIISITRQDGALSADHALIRILNCETKGLEDEVEIQLTSAPAVSAQNAGVRKFDISLEKIRSGKIFGD